MAVIKPFKALRPKPGIAAKLASRPYDVLSREEALKEAESNPWSFYHISKAEIDLPADIDLYDQTVYEKAKQNLTDFQRQGFLLKEEKPCYYLYQLSGKEHSQTGIVAVSSVADYENGVIKKHELTRTEKEKDRTRHIMTTRAQTGNVFLAFRGVPELHTLIDDEKKKKTPVYDFETKEGIEHRIWIIDEEETVAQITTLFQMKVPSTYVADGHHRAASAAEVSRKWRGKHEDSDAAHAYFLTTLFPDDGLQVFDYNRLVNGLNGLSKEEFLSKLEYDFGLTKTGKTEVKPAEPHEFGMYFDGEWYRLIAEAGSYETDVVGELDVTILQNNILQKLLGIGDPRTDGRISYLPGVGGLQELEEQVDKGEATLAFALHPVPLNRLFEVADNGRIMPPKSTWFEPKLRDGLFTHLI